MLFFFQVQYQNLVNELIKNFIIFHEVWLLNVILVSHLRLANFITIDAHNQIISKEVATVHKNFDRNTRSSSSSLSSIGYLSEWWRGNGLWEIHIQWARCCRVSVFNSNTNLYSLWNIREYNNDDPSVFGNDEDMDEQEATDDGKTI